jgi:hypothetical protein
MSAEARINFHRDAMETGNVVALPIDDTSEHALLAGFTQVALYLPPRS